jgi:Family of unknown function (DUF6492)
VPLVADQRSSSSKRAVKLPGCEDTPLRTISAVLPLKISGKKLNQRTEDLARCDILLTSLTRFAAPGLFQQIFVVVPAREEQAVRSGLLRLPTLPLTVISEEVVLPLLRYYRTIGGWALQQVVKLAAAALVETEFFLTLDADVALCRPLAFDDLFVDGKALMQPAARALHPNWWRGSAHLLGLSLDLGAPGMAVTPALLSRSVCKELFSDLEQSHRCPWARVLLDRTDAPWTEYTLYYLTAERHGLLEQFHVLPRAGGRRLLCPQSVWEPAHIARWNAAEWFSEDQTGVFAVIQSNTGIPPRKVRSQLRPYLGETRPGWRLQLTRIGWRCRLDASQSRLGGLLGKWLGRARQVCLRQRPRSGTSGRT